MRDRKQIHRAKVTHGKKQLVVVTGMSGAGKTLAIRSFEDLGFFCIDNLPPDLMSHAVEHWQSPDKEPRDLALVVDSRSGRLFDDFLAAFGELAGRSHDGFEQPRILFLDANDDVLLKRFKETRRKHPMFDQGGGILESIREERRLLSEVKVQADKVLDTSNLEPLGLRREISRYFGAKRESAELIVTIVSFGFKFGIPLDADLVFDVRFLANPHYVKELQQMNGNSPDVAKFVLSDPLTEPLLERLAALLEFSIPQYKREGKAYLTIAIGCTGGRHRSVVIANELAQSLRRTNVNVIVRHRDVDEPRGRLTEPPIEA